MLIYIKNFQCKTCNFESTLVEKEPLVLIKYYTFYCFFHGYYFQEFLKKHLPSLKLQRYLSVFEDYLLHSI